MYRPTSSAAEARPFRDAPAQLRDLTQDFVMAFNTGNYDQAAALFSSDGVLMVPQREAIFGPKPIEKLLQKMGQEGYDNLRMETIRVDHSGDMAMEIGRFSLVIRQANGTLTPETGKYVRVWRRLGVWRMAADCWSRTALSEAAA